jgi:hypothetical protein
LEARQSFPSGPTTPQWQRLPALPPLRFRLFPVRSPLLGESLLFSLPRGTEMFHFPRFPLPALCVQAGMARHDPYQVVLFGDPRIEACLAAPRGLSQPATSFIGFQRQGIHRVPFYTCRDDARARYRVLKVPHDRSAPSACPTSHTPKDAPPGRFARRPGCPTAQRGAAALNDASPRPSKLHSVPNTRHPQRCKLVITARRRSPQPSTGCSRLNSQ